MLTHEEIVALFLFGRCFAQDLHAILHRQQRGELCLVQIAYLFVEIGKLGLDLDLLVLGIAIEAILFGQQPIEVLGLLAMRELSECLGYFLAKPFLGSRIGRFALLDGGSEEESICDPRWDDCAVVGNCDDDDLFLRCPLTGIRARMTRSHPLCPSRLKTPPRRPV
ncbi:hypothetical protein [Novosphingobium sp. THN1]|uniref:hypothetical protein n=1 Tax=Novosphingobium sp. THN1 TaxID=1016987 RepID=UPI001F07B9B1|nr:hypothetical protein [Novosphingobium sp. THN1]